MNLLGLTLTNPALWAGAFALAIPAAVHLLARRTPTRLIFPAIRFLKKARASQSLPYRLRHWIMMLVRTALVALLLLAFLKPVARPQASAAVPAGNASRAAVVILDASLSMGYSRSGVSPFAKGQAAARQILDGLDAGSAANLILAGAVPRSSFDRPMPTVAGLLRDIERARPTLERADMDAAIAEAVKQLGKASDFSPEIHFVSDFQRSNWAAVKFGTLPKNVRTVFVNVAEESPANAALTEVLLQPAVPAAGENVDVSAKVSNYGPMARDLAVRLEFEGESQTQHLSLAPGMTETARFRAQVARKGLFEGVLRIDEDPLAADDARFFAFDATERVQVLILTDEPVDGTPASHRFLSRAINPYREGGTMVTEVLAPPAFDAFAASRAHLLIVTGVRDFPEACVERLVAYLKDGGSLIYFLGRPTDKDNLERLVTLAKGDLELPFRLGNMQDRAAAEGAGFAAFTGANFDDPILRKFKEGGDLGEIHCYRLFATEREKGQGQVLLRYDDGSIAMARKSLGLGSLLLCNFSPDLENSDLAKRTIFVPLLHEMIRNLRPQSGGRKAFHVGTAASTTVKLLAPNAPLVFTDPGGQRMNGTFEENGGEAAVFFPVTSHPGFYHVDAGEAHIGSVAVNVDSRESNLESLTTAQLRELSAVPRDRFITATAVDVDRLGELIGGRPVWHYFMLAALALIGVEQVLALWWRK